MDEKWTTYNLFNVRVLGQIDARNDSVEHGNILIHSLFIHLLCQYLLRIGVKVFVEIGWIDKFLKCWTCRGIGIEACLDKIEDDLALHFAIAGPILLLVCQHLVYHSLQNVDLVETRPDKKRDKLGGLLIAEVVEPFAEALDERVVGLRVFPLLPREHLEQVEELAAPELLERLDLARQVVRRVQEHLVVDGAVKLASCVVFEGEGVEEAIGKQVGGNDLVKDRVESLLQQSAVVDGELARYMRYLQ